MINAIVMASGYSRRMGKNKLLLPFKGQPLIEHVLDAVLQCDFKDAILVGRDNEVLNLAQIKGIKTVVNNNAASGQSESIKLGINNLLDAEAYMFFTGDQPLLDVKTINLLLDKFRIMKNFIIVPKCGERRGSPVIFPRIFKEELLNLQGDAGGRELIKNHGDRVCFVDIERSEILFDVDTVEEYNKLLSIK